MGLGDTWHKIAVYFGIADEEEYEDEETMAPQEELERSYKDRPNVRKLDGARGRNEYDEIFADEPRKRAAPSSSSSQSPVVRAIEPARPSRVEVHLVIPRSFNDAQQVADKFKVDVPVILNLQNADTDLAKRLIDYGFHPPTNYFPLIVPEAFMIEPTETESKETLDAFAQALRAIRDEALTDPEVLHEAPHSAPVGRLDEVRAARQPVLRWQPDES